MSDLASRGMQDYLKAIHRLGGVEQVVSPVELAAQLEVRAPSVTSMLKRLAEGGWVQYEPGRGARLTATGIAEARRIIRRHRLMELFLTRVLGLDWSEVDAEAEILEHAISPRLEQAIADYLGDPPEDPHGHPIPTRDGELVRCELQPLHSFPSGQRVVIREVQDDNPDRLRRWSALGLLPGARVKLLGRQDLDGTFEVEVGEKVVTLAAQGLAGLLAEATTPCNQGERSKEERHVQQRRRSVRPLVAAPGSANPHGS